MPCRLFLDFAEWVEEVKKEFVKRECRSMILRAVRKSTIVALVSMNFPNEIRLLLLVKVFILLHDHRPHNLV